MRIMRFLLVGCLFGTMVSLATSSSAVAQESYPSPVVGAYARRPPVYPSVRRTQRAYHKAVRYGLMPVAPPLITNFQDGRGLYGPPYYAYPRPPLEYSGYAGFSGVDPYAYRAVIPPPIPPTIPHASPNSQSSAPTPPSEPIPTPPSDPGSKP
jgi:hypothetical protein